MNKPIKFNKNGKLAFEIRPIQIIKIAVIAFLTLMAGALPIPGITDASRISLMIFIAAAGLWITEAIPPFATAVMVIVLNIYLLGLKGGPLGHGSKEYAIFLNPIASPILVIFFAGFVLSIAATKHKFDVQLARAFIKPFGTRPAMVLLGVICITALFSMFMSNTATTAMMIAILSPLFNRLEGRKQLKRAMALAVPFAANIGGHGHHYRYTA